MSLLEFLFLALILYYVVYVLLWLLLDSNVELWYKARYGVPLSTLRSKVVWITGASSGIGKALALELARQGVRLVLSARRENRLQTLRSDCLKEAGQLLNEKDVLVLPMDMLDTASHEPNFKRILDHFGTLDILVNNAGRSQRASWEEIDVSVDRELFELDVFSVMNLSRIVVRYFLRERGGRGHIAVTSSIAGFAPVPFSATYCAAKHALNAYMMSLRVEQRDMDVTVFAPGPTATEFLQEAFTAKPNIKYGQGIENQKRMTAERCGQLFAVAIANKLELVWCGLFPVTFLAYVARIPALAKILFHLMGKSTMNKIREGKI